MAIVGTNGNGRFVFKATRGPSRTLRFRYPGTNLVRARTSEVDISVSAGATLRASRERVVNGGDVRFTGRVLGRHLPATGKLVELQAYSRGEWRTFATPRRPSPYRAVVALVPVHGDPRHGPLPLPCSDPA